ncbi:hypothetical protein EC968_004871 [Mortierella alpina]|nr:hypothetical protein EC968_004871 [Mortierella alpina]
MRPIGEHVADFKHDDQTPYRNMKRLTFSLLSVNPRDQLDFITQCPNLEHLAWKGFERQPLKELLATLTAAQETNRLVSLDFTNTRMSDARFLRFLKLVPNLRRLIASRSMFGEDCCQWIIGNLQNRLEELDVKQCSYVASPMIQAILMNLKALKRFKGEALSVRDLRGPRTGEEQWAQQRTPPQSTEDNPPLPRPIRGTSSQPSWKWACTSLEELDLTLRGLEKSRHSKSSMKTIYGQLSNLVELKTLVLTWRPSKLKKGGPQSAKTAPASSPSSQEPPLKEISCSENSLDLGLSSGLESLITLRKLRVLDLRNVKQLDLMAADVWWMCKHWPSLRTIRGTLTTRVEEAAVIRKVVDNRFPHVKLDPEFGITLEPNLPIHIFPQSLESFTT